MQSCIKMNTERHFMTTVINIYRLLHVYMSCPFYAAPSNKVLSSFPTRKCLSCPKLIGHDRPMHINAVGCCIGVICLISRDRLQPSPPSWPAALQEDWGPLGQKKASIRRCRGAVWGFGLMGEVKWQRWLQDVQLSVRASDGPSKWGTGQKQSVG